MPTTTLIKNVAIATGIDSAKIGAGDVSNAEYAYLNSLSSNVQTQFGSAGGGAWNLIGTQVASTSATLTQTGLDSTYDTYAIGLSDMHPGDDHPAGYMRFGDSSGIDSGASDYSSWYQFLSAGGYSGSGDASASSIYLSYATGFAAGEGMGAVFFLHRPGDGTTQPMISGTQLTINAYTAQTGGVIMGKRNAVIVLDRVQFLFATGNIISGRMTTWGIAHA
jgi:hypothetical protein